MEKIRVQRFGKDQIEKVNLRVEKPPDCGAFAARNLATSEGFDSGFVAYGGFGLDDKEWELSGMAEWEIWQSTNHAIETKKYLIYFPSVFHGIIWSTSTSYSDIQHAKQDVNKLRTTMFTNMEALHILEEVLQVKGIRKKMVHKYMETLTDSLIRNMEMSGIKILESLTSSPILVHRAAPIHSKLVKILTSHAYAKNSKAPKKKGCPACHRKEKTIGLSIGPGYETSGFQINTTTEEILANNKKYSAGHPKHLIPFLHKKVQTGSEDETLVQGEEGSY